ncbi:MAG: hypothetical protein ACT4NP_08650 [Pseudonocardiales bacterium]
MAEGLVTLAQADGDVLTEDLPADLSMEQMQQMEQLWAGLERGLAITMEPEVAAERILAALGDRGWSDNNVRTAGDE